MSLIKTASKIAAVATGLIATSAMAGTIVVRATGPSAAVYKPGTAITATSLTLKPGDTLVLLDAKGTRTLSGVGPHSLSGGSAAVAPSALGALIRSSGARQVRTGAVRGTGLAAAKAPNIWYVDASRSGTVCVAETGMTNVWRPNMTAPAAYSVWSGGKSVPLNFTAGQSVAAWPAELPLTAGTHYKIAAPTGAPVEIVVQPVAVSESADTVGASLIAKGCTRQLDQLVEAGQSSPAS